MPSAEVENVVYTTDCHYWLYQCNRVLFAARLRLDRPDEPLLVRDDVTGNLDKILHADRIETRSEWEAQRLLTEARSSATPLPPVLKGGRIDFAAHGVKPDSVARLKETLSAIQSQPASSISRSGIDAAEETLVTILRALQFAES